MKWRSEEKVRNNHLTCFRWPIEHPQFGEGEFKPEQIDELMAPPSSLQQITVNTIILSCVV